MHKLAVVAVMVVILAAMVVPAWGSSHEPQGACSVFSTPGATPLENHRTAEMAVSEACMSQTAKADKRSASFVVASEYQYEEEPNIGQYCVKDKATKGGNACGQQGLK